MMNSIKIALLGTALAAFLLPAAAQTDAASAANKHHTIRHRKVMQQERIANGVKSGEMTRGETRSVEKQEAEINQETRAMRKDDNGKLTPADRAKVQHQQDQLSKQIWKDKHNNKTR